MDNVNTNKNYTQFRKYYRSIGPILDKPKNRVYSTLIFSLLAISLFSFYAIKPTVQTILKLKREIQDKTVLNEKMEQKIAQLIEAQNSYMEAEQLLPLIYEAIPETPDPLDIADQITKASQQSGINIQNINVGDSKYFKENQSKKDLSASQDPRTLIASMNVNGDYQSLENFLNTITKLRRLIILQNFNLSDEQNTSDSQEQILLNSVLNLKSFYD